MHAYEIKYAKTLNKSMARGLTSFAQEYKLSKCAILSLRKEALPLTQDVMALHWSSVTAAKDN